MNIYEIFNLFLIVSAIQGVLFFMVIILSKHRANSSIFFISLLVLTMALNNLQSWLLAKEYLSSYRIFQIPFHFFIAPFFYQFLIHYLQIKDKSRNLLKASLITFAMLLVVKFTFIYNYKSFSNFSFLMEKYIVLEEVFSMIVSLSIFFYAFHVLSKKENLFVKILSFDNLRWIYTFFKLGLFSYGFWIVALAITIALQFNNFIYAYYPLRVFTTILIYWIGFQAIKQLRILNERKVLRSVTTTNIDDIFVDDFKSDDKLDASEFKKFERKLIKENFFTEPKLSVESLANKLNISAYKLSTLIKENTDKNFNDFINAHRIEFAKKMLLNKVYKNYTITAIGLEAGFNSKSSFYATFKKHAGVTPLEYKKSKGLTS